MSGGSPNRDSTGRPAGPAFGTLQEAVDHLTGKYQPEGMRRTKVDKALKALDDAERAEDMALKEAKGDLAGRFGVGVGRAITHNHGQVTVAHAHPGFAETTGGAGHTHKPLYAEGEKGLSSSGPGRNPAAGENDMTLKYSEASQFVCKKANNHILPPNRPIVGRDVFRVESGIGLMFFHNAEKAGDPKIVGSIQPELVGQPPWEFVMGKKSGIFSVERWLKQIERTLNEEQKNAVLAKVKELAIAQKRLITMDEFKGFVNEVDGKKG